MSIILGAIADDFTGATDLANTLVQQGMRTVQLIGVPENDPDLADADAVVIALKSRTIAPNQAVQQSLDAAEWLLARGAHQLFFKYCSTFDSTRQGNIGPVSDALLDLVGGDLAIVCPAFPGAGRTIYKGSLFVNDQLLSESPMKDHPLTPMHDSNLCRLMDAQSAHSVGLVNYQTVLEGVPAIGAAYADLARNGNHYAVIDTITDDDLQAIGKSVSSHALVTGGSGVALGLPDNYRAAGLLGPAAEPSLPAPVGRSAVLAGSCSEATRGQIANAIGAGWPALKVDIDALAAGDPVVETILDWYDASDIDKPVLIFGSAEPEEVSANQERYGRERAGELLEQAMGEVANGLVERGVRRLIVAGGETSGAVVTALNVRALRIGPEIAKGVPWTETLGSSGLALALKSGNFGSADFFDRALGMLA